MDTTPPRISPLTTFPEKKNLPPLISIFEISKWTTRQQHSHTRSTTHKHQISKENNTATTLRNRLTTTRVHETCRARNTWLAATPAVLPVHELLARALLPREEARGAARRPTIYWDDVIADTTSPLALIPPSAPSFSRRASPPTLVAIPLL